MFTLRAHGKYFDKFIAFLILPQAGDCPPANSPEPILMLV
jgi:hypothetical protein